MSTTLPAIGLKPREDIRIRRGHPWVYDNEIAVVHGSPLPGDEVKVLDSHGKALGYAFYNPASKIRGRIFSKVPARADEAFFTSVFSAALGWRKRYFDTERVSFRAVFGEADFAPGLIVDLYAGSVAGEKAARGKWLSCQFLSLGVEKRKAEIVAALNSVFSPDGILDRSDAPVRALEGLEPSSGILSGTVPDSIIMEENGALFAVDLAGGQKTGWFLDQRANRAAVARLARGKSVLDVFCNQGGFGILAARAGATKVIAVDSSAPALAAAAGNAALNGVSDKYETVKANAFDQLRILEKSGAKFDLIVLDPPAFAKSRSAVESAQRGYKEINVRAMRLLSSGGILATCSCSFWFDAWRFDAMLQEAAYDCGTRYRVVEERSQDLDHPMLSGYNESRYLKFRIVEML
jgi:23S rRNA (cytosine1962-C5)-methyltransferase